MCRKVFLLISVVLLLGSVSNAEDIQWTDLGADHLWSTPENWDLGRVPTLADEVLIDVPAAAAPNGPVIQDGIDAKAKGIFTEAPGEPTLTMSGGTLEVADWIWWGDGADSFGIWEMSGGTVSVVNEFELGWGGGAGTLTMTGGTINAGEAVIPTGSGAFGELYLNGGTYNVTKADGLSVKENGLIDITQGTLVLEGDDTAKINDLIAAGLITAYGGDGAFELDYDGRNLGKTTLTAIPAPEPVNPGAEGLVAQYAMENDANDSSGNELHGTIIGDPVFVEGLADYGMALDFDGIDDVVELGKFDVVGQITMAAWIKADDFEINDARVISKANEWGGSDHWWMLSTISETSLRFRLKTDDGQDTTTLISDPVLEADVFTHVAATWDGNMMRIYKDGVEVASQEKGGSAVAVDPAVSVAIGSQPSDAFASDPSRVVKFFDGLIDDVRIYERALSEGEILYLAGKRATPVDPGTDGLVAFYALDGDTNDSSGNGNDGTISGTPNWMAGKIGSALEFDGSSTYVEIPFSESLRLLNQGDFTLSAWFKADEIPPENKEVLQQGDGNGTGRTWLFVHNSNEIRSFLGGGTTASGVSVEVGIWAHATVVVTEGGDADTVQLYVNGELAGEPSQRSMEDCEGVYFIGRHKNPTNFWDGLIDEVQLYNRALSGGEIRYLAGYRAPVDPANEGLAAYYALENDVLDVSGNGNDGTIVGNPTYVDGPAGYGMAMEFHGLGAPGGGGDYIDCGNDASLDITGPISIALWIRPGADDPEGQGTTTAPMAKAMSGMSPDWSWQVRYGWGGAPQPYMAFTFNTSPRAWAFVGRNLVRDEWCHIACSHDGTTLNCYLNGEQTDSTPMGAITSSETPVLIGSDGWGCDWIGAIDEVAIYNRALSDSEIMYLAGN